MEYLVNPSDDYKKMRFSYITEDMLKSDTDASLIKLVRKNRECEMTDFAKFLMLNKKDIQYSNSDYTKTDWVVDTHNKAFLFNKLRPYGSYYGNPRILDNLEYPQDMPNVEIQSMLETLYSTYISSSDLVKEAGVGYLEIFKTTGKTYSLYTEKDILTDIPEYIWGKRKFIRLIYQGKEESILLGHKIFMYGDPCWFEVSKIKWLYDYNLKQILSEKILVAGLSFIKYVFDYSESESSYAHFLHVAFKDDILPSKIPDKKKYNIDIIDSKIIFDYKYKDYLDSEINIDFSDVKEIRQSAFENCVNLQYLIFPSARYVGTNAFNNCPNLELSFPTTSLIKLDIDGKSYAISSEIFLKIFNVKKLTICSKEIPLDETAFHTFRKLQGQEIEGIIRYVLDSLNLKYDYPYFKYDIVEAMQNCDIDLVKKPIYNYIINHKLFTFMTNKKLKEFIDEKIKEYYDVSHTYKDAYNELVKIDNPLIALNPNEVLQKIMDEKTGDIDINVVTTIMDYGSNFDNYFSYVASTFSEAVIKHNDITESVNKLKSLIIDCKKSDKDISKRYKLTEKIFAYTNENNKKLQEEIEYLEILKKIILIDIQKLTILGNNLNNYVSNDLLINEIIAEKINSFNNMILSLKQEFDQINLYLTIDLVNKTRMQFIKNNLLPILNLNKVLTSSGLSKDELRIINKVIKSFNKPIDDSIIPEAPKFKLSSLVPPNTNNSLPDAFFEVSNNVEEKEKRLLKK